MILIKEKTDANNKTEMKKDTKTKKKTAVMIVAGDAQSRMADHPAERETTSV